MRLASLQEGDNADGARTCARGELRYGVYRRVSTIPQHVSTIVGLGGIPGGIAPSSRARVTRKNTLALHGEVLPQKAFRATDYDPDILPDVPGKHCGGERQ